MNAIRTLLILAVLSLPVAAGAADCIKCHTCEQPTPDEPCLSDCPRSGEQPSMADFAAMDLPEICVLDQLVDRYEPVTFNHAQHAKMSGMGGASCRLCHHANEQGWVGNCYGCHPAHLAGRHVGVPDLKTAYHRQCMFCHKEWSHETSCEVCHAPRGTTSPTAMPPKMKAEEKHGFKHRPLPKVVNFTTTYEPAPYVSFDHASHTTKYGLNCFECHHSDQCAACHDSDASKFSPRLHNFSNINTCTKCHNAGRCSTCHSQEAERTFDHAFTGMPLKTYHQDLSCDRCHEERLTHGQMPRECHGCHGDWSADDFNEASFDHGTKVGVHLREFHEGLNCQDCHPGKDYAATPICHDCHDDAMTPGHLR
jgi:hypothetical protein